MITKDRVLTILNLALPVTIGLGSSFIMVFVDLAMVGTLGNNALAAVGLAGFSYTLVLALVMALAPAVQGIVARRAGEGSSEAKCLPLNAGLLLALLIGIPLTVICYFITPFFLSSLSSDPAVTKEGIPFLRALFMSIVAAGMNSAFQGYYSGINKTKVFMLIVLAINCLNIFLNYIFIFGNLGSPALGTMGAGVASAISVSIGCFIYYLITFKYYRKDGFLSAKPGSALLSQIVMIGLPENIREMLYSLGYVLLYWMVGQIGTAELAGMNILVRVTLLLLLFANALGMASATLVSNSLGKGDAAGAAEWGWDIAKIAISWVTLLGLPMVLFPRWFLSLFISDPYTVSIATIPMQLTGALTGIVSLIYIFAYTLISLGDGKRVLLVSFSTQWIFFLPAVWVVGPYLKYGLLEISIVQVIYGLMATGLIVALWNSGRWKEIKI